MFGPRQVRSLLIAVTAALLVAGCSGTARGPSALAPGAVVSQAAPIKGEKARFAFAPVSGAPLDVLRDMSAAMNQEARTRRIQVVPNGDPSATYVVRGYLSAVSDGPGPSTLVYVWDVLDRNGVRLHRITGQEKGRAAGDDSWSGIGEPTIEVAARKTMDALSEWVNAG